jgi:hypothetical protein
MKQQPYALNLKVPFNRHWPNKKPKPLFKDTNNSLFLKDTGEHFSQTVYIGNSDRPDTDQTNQIIDGISKIFNIDKSELKLRYLRDKITFQLLNEDKELEILKVDEEKIKYQRQQNKK